MSLLLVVDVYRLCGERGTLMATGMFKGEQMPCSTTQAEPLPRMLPNDSFSFDVGRSEGMSYPLIFMIPSGLICRSCRKNRSPSVPISEKILFSISLTSSQSICRFIFLLPPMLSRSLQFERNITRNNSVNFLKQQEHGQYPVSPPRNIEEWIAFNELLILLMKSSFQNFNPEDTALSMMTKSYLKPREVARQTGSKFFQQNKIRSCSYVQQTKDGFKAVPFYDKRDTTQYPTPSNVTRSWSSNTHNNQGLLHAGMGVTKPLLPYHPSVERNLIKIADFRPPYPNSSHIQIGQRNERDVKRYTTTYGNSFIPPKRELESNHPGIQASRNQWMISRLKK